MVEEKIFTKEELEEIIESKIRKINECTEDICRLQLQIDTFEYRKSVLEKELEDRQKDLYTENYKETDN